MKILAIVSALTLSVAASAQGGGVAQKLEGRPHLGLHHAAITVSDIDATVAFYSKAVPYKVVKRYKVKGSAFPKRC